MMPMCGLEVRGGADVVGGGLGVAVEIGHRWPAVLRFSFAAEGIPPGPAKLFRINNLRGGFLRKNFIPKTPIPIAKWATHHKFVR